MIIITIQFEGREHILPYKKTESGQELNFDVIVSNPELNKYTGGQFRITLLNRDNILSYQVNGPTDFKVKGLIISEIFKKEKIYFIS
jgi:hypothetical protein